jgi:hypothetical protein
MYRSVIFPINRVSSGLSAALWTLPLQSCRIATIQVALSHILTIGTWHALAHTPLTEPKVSTITVNVDTLEIWEDHWLNLHRNHSDPDDSEANGNGVEWGILPDYDEEEDEKDDVHLLQCCGELRPRKKNVCVVVQAAADGEGFITVHDYLSVVHPWLMTLRNDILGAMSSAMSVTLSPATELMVNCNALDDLMIELKVDWMRSCSTGLKEPPPSLPIAVMGVDRWRPFAETAGGRMPPPSAPPRGY